MVFSDRSGGHLYQGHSKSGGRESAGHKVDSLKWQWKMEVVEEEEEEEEKKNSVTYVECRQ